MATTAPGLHPDAMSGVASAPDMPKLAADTTASTSPPRTDGFATALSLATDVMVNDTRVAW